MSIKGSRRRQSKRQSKGERNREKWRAREGAEMAKMMAESVDKQRVDHTCPLHLYIMEKKKVGSCKYTHSSESLIHISASFDFCMCVQE